jgi:hypothetical protein
MPLKFPRPPDDCTTAANATLDSLWIRLSQPTSKAEGSKKAILRKKTGSPQVDPSTARRVYILDRRGITPGAGLKKAKAAGWRYTIQARGGSSSRPVEAISMAARAGEYIFNHISRDWLEQKCLDAIEALAKLPQVRSGSFDVCMLRIASIYFVDALWLKTKRRNRDLIVPISSSRHLYSVREFLGILRKLASQQVFNNRPRYSESVPAIESKRKQPE